MIQRSSDLISLDICFNFFFLFKLLVSANLFNWCELLGKQSKIRSYCF
uniref:Uncharacterized protein n=1 Tax=Rhizophora mucronata TaxID=61149 RepID=A0A2P2QVI0_RHIMU